MNRKFFSLSLVIPAAFWMAACSDSEISSSDISTITQSIFIVPEGYTGEPYNRSYTSDEFYVNVNEKIRICGVYSIDGKYVSTEKAMPYKTMAIQVVVNGTLRARNAEPFDRFGRLVASGNQGN